MKSKLFLQLVISVMLVLAGMAATAQQAHLQKGDEFYNRLAYSEAIPEYEKVLEKYPDLTAVKIKLADCYRMTGASEKAERWYGQIAESADAKPVYTFYYVQALMNNKKYEKAKAVLTEYQKNNPDDKRAVFAMKSIENMPVYFKDTASYKTAKPNINSENGDFCPVVFDRGVVFASSRETQAMGQKKHEWTGQPFLNLFYAEKRGSVFASPVPFATNVQIRYNDGPVCFNKKGNEIYITRNNIERSKALTRKSEAVRLKIIHAIKQDDKWKETETFKYNDDNYSCVHPALNEDGTLLFFSSDMPGGYGGMDLYVCEKDSGGWGKPKNLGEKINTGGNDLFPYLHEDGTFVFASNSRDGLGGLDIYWCRMKNNVFTTEPVNIGAPVNSSEDDFGVIFDNTSKTGYYSSNRESKNANDDIYTFKKMLKLKGLVVEKKSEKPIPGATVVLKNKSGADIQSVSKEDGSFEFQIECGIDYAVEATKDGWSTDNYTFSTVNYFPVEDLFATLRLEKVAPKKIYQLIVKVIDKETRQPINTAAIGLDETDKTLGYTDAKGIWKQQLLPNTNLHMIITKAGYQAKVIYMSNEGQTSEKDYEFIVELRRGNDIGPFDKWYKIVYFDFDKSNIRNPDAAKTMMEVVEFLKAHPEARLLMNSYCDARGTAQYNMKLSRRRAEGATQFLVDHGIDRKMVEKMEWGGESMLINKCADGRLCSEEDHQLNRRTEIRVIRVERGVTMKQ